jgi:hypothetical protein
MYGQDDRLSFNTQTSSQWDGFRHWAFADGRFYNGVTQDEIRNTSSSRNGIHGIVTFILITFCTHLCCFLRL